MPDGMMKVFALTSERAYPPISTDSQPVFRMSIYSQSVSSHTGFGSRATISTPAHTSVVIKHMRKVAIRKRLINIDYENIIGTDY